ncbi:amidohydrolase family protein [Peptacetobacter hominis]|uniref:Amidohydrolase family protein n=1 Tax=Peptacetobacter hominis TaxID=2743610 RepID=A0A544QUJ5_9FIRM|nr:amidohydrolase family protein [Peptacetobacter hominis]TQQ84383.1 amidohydrolase family protein [Peptacetobacter hominis]
MILSSKRIITGDGKTVLEDSAVYVNERGIIEAVGKKEDILKAYPDEKCEDYGDATIIPGMCDMHAHLGYWYSQPDSFNYNDQMIMMYALQHAQAAFTKGITSIRDCYSPKGVCKTLKMAEDKGFITIPRITHVDAGMCMTGGHCWDEVIQVDGPWAIRKEIRTQVRDGAEWVKVLTSHRSHIPEYTQEELDVAADECKRRGIKCVVHAGTHPSIQMCIDAGFDTIEHGTFLTVEQAKQMKEKGIAWTPTMFAYTYLYEVCSENLAKGADVFNDPVAAKEQRDFAFYEPAYEAYRDNFKKLYDTGVTVCTGSDMVMYGAPVLPIAEEMELMVKYGITPVQAIQTATANPAKVLGREEELGMIKEGLIADITVVKGDLSEDISCVHNIDTVFLNGKKVYSNGVRYI